MNPELMERASEVLLLLLELDEEVRPARLAALCADDVDLRREVSSLLAHHDRAFLQTPPPPPGTAGEGLAPRLQRLGPFRIRGVLGRGGMGIVYDAEQDFPRRAVALKVIRADLIDDDLAGRLRREAQVLARLQHPGIAQIHSAGRARTALGPLPYIAMERVDGLPIDRFARERGLDADACVALLALVCDAVAHAHARGIVHRDLKPANVLVDAEGRPRVLDFGVARLTGADERSATLRTGTGLLVGTLAYMSPEQASGDGPIDLRSDVYSLGVVLYELLTGELPVAVGELPLHRAVQAVQREPPTPLRLRRPGTDRDLETILLKALEKERERRYGSAADLAEDLRRYLRREPISARPATAWYQARRFAQRNRALVAGTAAVFLTLAAGATVSAVGFYRAEARSRQVLQLSDSLRLAELEREAGGLWPALPERVGQYRDWLVRAEELADAAPEHERALAALPDDGSSSAEWWRASLRELLAGLERFRDPDPFVGAMSSVRARLALAEELERRSLVEPRERWREARESIADPARCPAYAGLELSPQLGLVPLVRDPDSGLWEFALLASGPPAAVGPDGRVRPGGGDGLVLVLVPGGTYRVGAQIDEPREPLHDPGSLSRERATCAVDLAPFFIAKYEVTQAQWKRIVGADPSVYPAGKDYGIFPAITDLHPVENVSWEDCAVFLSRLGLDFPTEVQWEAAARGGATTPWWTGADEGTLAGAANLADRFALDRNEGGDWPFEPWLDDGYSLHAPVGRLRPNPFGLHDVHGNVAEWCKDPRPTLEDPPRPLDGLRARDAAGANRRIARGGSFALDAERARLAARRVLESASRSDDVGLRPVRALSAP